VIRSAVRHGDMDAEIGEIGREGEVRLQRILLEFSEMIIETFRFGVNHCLIFEKMR
jgi:hypothetical protein